MAATVSKNGVLKLGTAAAPTVLTDISTKVTSVKFSRDIESLETTAFQGGSSKAFIAGLIGGSLSCEANWDTALDAHLFALGGVDGVSFEFAPEGSTAGMVKYTGSCILTKYEPPASVGAVVKVSFELQITGAVARNTYA